MRFNGMSWFLLLILSIGFVFAQTPSSSKPSDRQAALGGETKINVFFGTTKALSIGEIRTNAVTELRRKGYNVPADATCVISVAVLGPKAGCTVMFWDFKTKWTYQVGFDGQGNVSEICGGAIRHGTVGPKDPLPTVPAGGIKMKP
jgi:hypothetical protein